MRLVHQIQFNCLHTHLLCDAAVSLILQMVAMPWCTHSLCKDCFKRHFTGVINEQSVKHFNCPMCGEPNHDDSQAVDFEVFVSLVSYILYVHILVYLVTDMLP